MSKMSINTFPLQTKRSIIYHYIFISIFNLMQKNTDLLVRRTQRKGKLMIKYMNKTNR